MSIISTKRALAATNDKLRQMQHRRKNAKDKPRWDVKNGNKMAALLAFQAKLGALLLDALVVQGQFNHTDVWARPDADTKHHD